MKGAERGRDGQKAAPGVRGGSPARIWFLAATTFTQLLRMKVLYFLLIFGVLIVVASTFNVFHYAAEQQMKLLKDVSLGVMSLFTSVVAIVATAMLIPRDIEDRTLYTILAKAVPRYDYLIGKLLGVLLVLAVSLVVMDLLFSAVLYARQEVILQSELGEFGEAAEANAEAIALYRQRVEAQGLTWNLQNAAVAIFLKAGVLAAATILVSMVASTSLFTIIVSFVIFFIGHISGVARDYWAETMAGGVVMRLFGNLVVLVFPDFQLFNVVDGVVAGEVIPLGAMMRLTGLASMYLVIYTLVAYLIFSEKEL